MAGKQAASGSEFGRLWQGGTSKPSLMGKLRQRPVWAAAGDLGTKRPHPESKRAPIWMWT